MVVLFLQFSPKGNRQAKERLAKCTEQEVEDGGQVSACEPRSFTSRGSGGGVGRGERVGAEEAIIYAD